MSYITLATLSSEVFGSDGGSSEGESGISDHQLYDFLSYANPDVVVTNSSSNAVRVQKQYQGGEVLSMAKIENRPNRLFVSDGDGAQIVCVGSQYDLQKISQMESNGRIDTSSATFILSSLLDVEIDLVNLEVDLEGERRYISSLYGNDLSGVYTHLTTEASPLYRNVWDNGLKVNGAFCSSENDKFDQKIGMGVCLLYDDGIVDSSVYNATQFGLESINQVGAKKSITLVNNDYTSVSSVANMTVDKIKELDGFGPKNAIQSIYSARAISNGELFVESTEYLPEENHYDPVFVDIVSNGVKSSTIWLIGVYDSWTEEYMNFISTEPGNPEKVVSDFLSWVSNHCPNRPIVSYNGVEYDFQMIHEHATKHCDEYIDMFDDAWHFDPLWWGPRMGNAIFPSKTNNFRDVASALGWEYECDITKEAIEKKYAEWEKYQTSKFQPDWSLCKTHTKDRVFSLEHIYNSIQDAPRIDDLVDDSNDSSKSAQDSSQPTQDINNT